MQCGAVRKARSRSTLSIKLRTALDALDHWSETCSTPDTVDEVLSSDYVLEYTYTRSVGEVIGRFLAGLRDGRVHGVRTVSGRVLVPPTEYDPNTGERCRVEDFVEVGTSGTVKTWAWVTETRQRSPLQKPFAWALIQLDGADTSLLHAVDAGSSQRMKTGMRVKIRWASERRGRIEDIACFDPEGA
jgi:uncharacterized protein